MVAGVACFALFVAHEARARHPMLELSLFRIRNFRVANLTTLAAYAGLIGGLFFVGLFLQQVAGYTPIEAGLATTPVSLILFFLSPRWGRLASGTGPRLPMSLGPIVGGVGLILLTRVGADADYVADVLPAILVFGLGLSATVAPLTATVLDSVEERHVGIASGVNNGIARVAGLLSIAVLGAVISATSAPLDSNLGAAARPARRGLEAKAQPLAVPAEALTPREATRVARRRRRLDLGLPPRGADRRPADDRRRRLRRLRDREPEAQGRGGGEPRRGGGRRVRPQRRLRPGARRGAGTRSSLKERLVAARPRRAHLRNGLFRRDGAPLERADTQIAGPTGPAIVRARGAPSLRPE